MYFIKNYRQFFDYQIGKRIFSNKNGNVISIRIEKVHKTKKNSES